MDNCSCHGSGILASFFSFEPIGSLRSIIQYSLIGQFSSCSSTEEYCHSVSSKTYLVSRPIGIVCQACNCCQLYDGSNSVKVLASKRMWTSDS
jgi:hypothetical protein